MTMKFTLEDTAIAQRRVAITKAAEGITLMQAYNIAERMVEKQGCLHPAGFYVDDLNMLKPIPHSTEKREQPTSRRGAPLHREVAFTFSDGTTLRGCLASDCYWGKRNPDDRTKFVKKHSDGTPGGTLYSSAVLGDVVEEDGPEVEQTSDDPIELQGDGLVKRLIDQTDIVENQPEESELLECGDAAGDENEDEYDE